MSEMMNEQSLLELIQEKEEGQMPKQCYFCKGETQEQKVRVDFRWGEDLVIIESVPATVCQQCGEQYFDAQVSRQMEKLAKARLSAKRVVHVPVRHFAEVELIPVS